MKKKFAVCFSGYPRFVKTTFDTIKENLLDGLGDYDIYANLQWDSENWESMEIHHEHSDKFENNELEDFKTCYSDLNLKKLKVNEPFEFDVSYYDKRSAEPDMPLSLDQSQDTLYRFKSQYQGIADCVGLIDNLDDYEYIIRMRTDLIFESPINMEDLETDVILNQNGYVAGRDRDYSDWFFVIPTKSVKFVDDLAKVEEHFSDGIIHMHKLLENVAKPYGIENAELYVGTPSTSKMFGELLKNRK